MKKLYILFFTILISTASFGQDLIISGVYDGPLTGGTPKGVEIYVLNDIADLSIYGLGSANNGGGTDGEEFTFPADAATAGDFIYVASEAPQFTAFFGFAPNYTSGSMEINGDDAVELFMSGSVIDLFGDINTDGTGQVWDHLDGWAYRNNDSDPSVTFDSSEWSFSGTNVFDGETSNATATTPFPIGTFTYTTAGISDNNIENFGIYPNPVSNGEFKITTAANVDKQVSIFNMLGKQVLNKTVKANESINISNLNTGVYFVNVVEEGKTATKKLVIK